MPEAQSAKIKQLLKAAEVETTIYFHLLPDTTNLELIELKYPPQDIALAAFKTFSEHRNFNRKALPKLFECFREYIAYVSDVYAICIMGLLPMSRREFWRLMLINFCAALRPDENENPKLDYWAYQTTHRLEVAQALYRKNAVDFGRVIGYSNPDHYVTLIANNANKARIGDRFVIKIKLHDPSNKKKRQTIQIPVRLPYIATADYIISGSDEEAISKWPQKHQDVFYFVLKGIAIYGPTHGLHCDPIDKLLIELPDVTMTVSVLVAAQRV